MLHAEGPRLQTGIFCDEVRRHPHMAMEIPGKPVQKERRLGAFVGKPFF